MLRSLSGKSPTFQDIKLHCYDAEIANLRVESGAFLAGKTLGKLISGISTVFLFC